MLGQVSYVSLVHSVRWPFSLCRASPSHVQDGRKGTHSSCKLLLYITLLLLSLLSLLPLTLLSPALLSPASLSPARLSPSVPSLLSPSFPSLPNCCLCHGSTLTLRVKSYVVSLSLCPSYCFSLFLLFPFLYSLLSFLVSVARVICYGNGLKPECTFSNIGFPPSLSLAHEQGGYI